MLNYKAICQLLHCLPIYNPELHGSSGSSRTAVRWIFSLHPSSVHVKLEFPLFTLTLIATLSQQSCCDPITAGIWLITGELLSGCEALKVPFKSMTSLCCLEFWICDIVKHPQNECVLLDSLICLSLQFGLKLTYLKPNQCLHLFIIIMESSQCHICLLHRVDIVVEIVENFSFYLCFRSAVNRAWPVSWGRMRLPS